MTVRSDVTASRERLLRTVGALWPEADVVARRGRGTGRRLVYVPDARSPKLLVPAGAPGAAARAMWRFSDALTGRERLSRLLGATGLRLGLELALRDRLELRATPSADSVERRLGELLDDDVVVSLGVGSLRANQKPVLQVFDRRGRTLAFVKVGDSPRNVELVRGEAAALVEVGEREWSSLTVPRLIHLGPWRDLELLVLSALPTSPRARRGPVDEPPLGPMAELAAAFPGGSPTLSDSVFLARLRARTVAGAGVDPAVSGLRADFTAALDRLETRLGGLVVPMGAWHGDFAPWNMSWHRGRLALWDWEQFSAAVPVGLDHAHYVVHTTARQHGFTRAVVDAALDRVGEQRRSAGLDRPDGAQLALLYLAAITSRYLQGADHASGAILHEPITLLLDLLRSRTSAPEARP